VACGSPFAERPPSQWDPCQIVLQYIDVRRKYEAEMGVVQVSAAKNKEYFFTICAPSFFAGKYVS
jgi:hypothetical protein